MERFKKIRDKRPVIIVKIGGRFSENEELLGIFADELYVMRNEYSFIIVHGGGNEVSLLSKKLGQEPLFKDGIRITTPEEMDIVEMVLSGKVNGRVVRKLRARGIDAVGLSGSDGSIFIGESMGNVAGVETRTGNVVKVTSKLLEILLDEGYVPVISSVSTDLEG
ncbi:MAG: acetylglutamate kinase, partial [Spirochaetes bacterium]